MRSDLRQWNKCVFRQEMGSCRAVTGSNGQSEQVVRSFAMNADSGLPLILRQFIAVTSGSDSGLYMDHA